VNNTTAVSKNLGSMPLNIAPGSVVTRSRAGQFLYLLVYNALTSAGVPTATPVQTLNVKPALAGFLIHPNGTMGC
jgi:hypothetical protein